MERTYNIPLRKEYMKAAMYRRSKKAVTAVKDFLRKHMKSEKVMIGKNLNEFVWKDGIKNPPHHVKVSAKKEDDVVYAELIGHTYKRKEKKEEKKKGLKDKLAEKVGVAKKEKKAEEEKEEAKPAKKE